MNWVGYQKCVIIKKRDLRNNLNMKIQVDKKFY